MNPLIFFNDCAFCNTSIRGDVVNHVYNRGLRRMQSEYHPSCFFVLQQRELEKKIKNPAYKNVHCSEAK